MGKSTTKLPAGTKVLLCMCKHQAQDLMHGASRRVHNQCKSGLSKSGLGWRCTVCGNEKDGERKQ